MITNINNIPDELKPLKQWVCWVGADKVPKDAKTGFNAKSNDDNTWSTFDDAVAGCERFGFDGLSIIACSVIVSENPSL